ncbi:MAG TPA: MauE/DoxX family redox-associated membrane protein [bacterium]|jgi:uncharacterized membrane protein YphA (DoxX/SURF4 family)
MNSTSKRIILLVLEWVCRLGIAVVYLLAAIPKLLDPLDFAKAIANYRVSFPIIGQDYIYPVAIFLPALEAVVAIALFSNKWKRIASLIAGAMLLMFIVLIGQAVARGLNIDCGCFGSGGVSKALASKVGINKILEDALWLVMCIFIFWRSAPAGQRRYALDRESVWK